MSTVWFTCSLLLGWGLIHLELPHARPENPYYLCLKRIKTWLVLFLWIMSLAIFLFCSKSFPSEPPFPFRCVSSISLFRCFCSNISHLKAHPDKALAMRLHAMYPDVYKDPNHKPEMVIALGNFECLSGFRHKEDICTLLTEYPEFSDLLQRNGEVSIR